MNAKKLKPIARTESALRTGQTAKRARHRSRASRPGALADERLSKLTRTYAFLSDLNQTIVRVREPQRLFDAACRIAIDRGGFRMAWIGVVDPQTKQLLPSAHAGTTDGYLEHLGVALERSGPGPTSACLRTGTHVVVNDIERDPGMALWRDRALQLGYRACAAFPLVIAGEVRGTFNLYAPEPEFFDAGELTLLDETAADIAFAMEFIEEDSQRRRADVLLRESEARYATLARISPVGIFRTDARGATTYVNPTWCVISGLSFERALGDGWLHAVHPDDALNLRRGWEESTRGTISSVAEYRFVLPDGTIAWVLGQAVPERNAEGQVVGYVGTITDITERKRSEAALQASEHQLSLIYASISDVLFYLEVQQDGRFRFLSVNAAFLEATGLKEDQVVGKFVEQVIPESAHALVLGNYREAIRTKKTVRWNEVSAYPAGKKYGEVSVTPVLEADGACSRLLGTVHDITERMQAEERLQHLNAELEARVARRTEQLNAALIQAQTADRLKSTFLATMSHELRTPLNSIIGFTGVMLQGLAGPLNAEQEKQLGMARDSARHLLALINDVLDISKIEAGQIEVTSAPFELRAAIEETVRTVTPQAQKKGLALLPEVGPGIGIVVSDRRRVQQILLNLLSNAIKFTDQGEVRLGCQTQDQRVEISVHDTGIGIRAEDLEGLFEPFHQLESGLDRRHEGTGLGLAICKNLVGLLGGQIRVESTFGTGSTFTFTLPLAPR